MAAAPSNKGPRPGKSCRAYLVLLRLRVLAALLLLFLAAFLLLFLAVLGATFLAVLGVTFLVGFGVGAGLNGTLNPSAVSTSSSGESPTNIVLLKYRLARTPWRANGASSELHWSTLWRFCCSLCHVFPSFFVDGFVSNQTRCWPLRCSP